MSPQRRPLALRSLSVTLLSVKSMTLRLPQAHSMMQPSIPRSSWLAQMDKRRSLPFCPRRFEWAVMPACRAGPLPLLRQAQASLSSESVLVSPDLRLGVRLPVSSSLSTVRPRLPVRPAAAAVTTQSRSQSKVGRPGCWQAVGSRAPAEG